ncbi:MAG: hypothetical protein MZV64_08045 [Ignavibacteriales bacterium]|nr:hypothetical protein [Ignavibacteriales bacterium]
MDGVICKNDTCSIAGPVWTFTTEQDPGLAILFYDDFESGIGNQTVTNNGETLIGRSLKLLDQELLNTHYQQQQLVT